MLSRCDANKKQITYKSYWGRGIKVCERWLKFENFLEDMGLRPEGYVIDRIDGNGNYELSNCRWVTPEENRKNRNLNISKYVYEIKRKEARKESIKVNNTRLINIDAAHLRDCIHKIMMKTEGLTIEKVAQDIGISTYTLRRFLKDTASRYTTVMRLKIWAWINKMEAL
jgi:AraC-like DNA-binding protein